jgi:MarR family transcriptional regulator, lower aerobic nicotinate degradation pathway regulator
VIHDQGCGDGESRAPARLRDRTFWLLGRAARGAQRLTADRLAQAGMHRGYYGVLATLAEFGPGAQAEISRRLGIDRSDMVAILNELENDGYVKRERDPDDRRRNRVVLTGDGLAALDRFDRAIDEAESAFLKSFSPAERKMLAALLERCL